MIKLLKIALFCCILTVSLHASKIVSVGGSITETIIALGHADDLIGVDLSSSYPKDIVSELPNVGYWLSLPKEGILSLKPEIAIVSSKSKPKKAVEDLPKYGIKTYIIEDKASLESAKKKIKQIADILNEQDKAKMIIERIETNVAKISKAIKGKKKPKVLFVFTRGKGTVMAAGPQTKPGQMISLVGGVNAVDFEQYSKISPESILQMNPDVIITSNHSGESGLDEGAVSSTNAGKNKQIYTMDMLLISGFTVRIDSALEKLSCMFNQNQLSYCKN